MIGTTPVMPSDAERRPAGFDIAGLGHVRHGTSGFEVGQNYLLTRLREDVRALGHEVHTAEEGEFGGADRRRLLRELVGVAAKIRELDDFVALVMMTQDDQAIAQLLTERPDPGVALFGGHLEVFAWDLLLAKRRGAVFAKRVGYAPTRLFRNAAGGVELRFDEP